MTPEEELVGLLTGESNMFCDAETPQELLGLLTGAASMCWEHVEDAGVFDSEQALRFADQALERLIEMGWST